MINWNIFFQYDGPEDDPEIIKKILKIRLDQLFDFIRQELSIEDWLDEADEDVLPQVKTIKRCMPKLSDKYWREQAKVAFRRNDYEITEEDLGHYQKVR
jgi:hypothetical protein